MFAFLCIRKLSKVKSNFQMNLNYNYNDNPELIDAIKRGHRGAYWDILRRVSEEIPPL